MKTTTHDSGIYVRRTHKPETVAEARALLHSIGFKPAGANAETRDRLETQLDGVQRVAEAILQGEPTEDMARDATRLIGLLAALRKAVADGNAKAAASLGIDLGRTYERLMVRPHEPDAGRGKKIVESAKQGHALVHGTADEKRARRLALQADFGRLYKPGTTKRTAIYKRVATMHGVSVRTVQRAVKELT